MHSHTKCLEKFDLFKVVEIHVLWLINKQRMNDVIKDIMNDVMSDACE